MVNYTTRNGQRVEVNVAAAYDRMAAAFRARFGLDLIVSSGVRTRQEQMDFYLGWINRRPGFNLALHPDNPLAYHVESNPRGPRALDLRDSGADAGVLTLGSARSNWLAANAPAYGFVAAGHSFSPREAWHYEFTGAVGGPGPASVASTSTPSKEPNMDIIHSNGKEYGIAPGFISHFGSAPHSAVAQRTTGKTVVKLTSIDDLARTLDNYGIPRDALSANGYVLNPQSGKHESNGLWTWERAVLAQITKR